MTASGDELLERIFAAPADDAARVIYADWLLERGDSHGELIHLQLGGALVSEAAVARERELVIELERRLAGPTALTTKRDRQIMRGFLAKVTLAKRPKRSMVDVLDAREWLTVEEIAIEDRARVPAVVFRSPTLRNLRRLRGATALHVRELARAGTPRLELLACTITDGVAAELLADPGHLASLRVLALASPLARDHRAAIAQSRFGSTLVRLEVTALLEELGDWLLAIEPTTIRELVVTNAPEIRCERTAAGWTISIGALDWDVATSTNLAAGVARVPRLASLTIAATAARYQANVVKALAPLGHRVRYI